MDVDCRYKLSKLVSTFPGKVPYVGTQVFDTLTGKEDLNLGLVLSQLLRNPSVPGTWTEIFKNRLYVDAT